MTDQPMEGPRWRVLLDREITRRKVYHLVVAPFEETVFYARHLSDCLAFLDAEGVECYELHPATNRKTAAELGVLIVRKV